MMDKPPSVELHVRTDLLIGLEVFFERDRVGNNGL